MSPLILSTRALKVVNHAYFITTAFISLVSTELWKNYKNDVLSLLPIQSAVYRLLVQKERLQEKVIAMVE